MLNKFLLSSFFAFLMPLIAVGGNFQSVTIEGQIFNESTGFALESSNVTFTASVYSPGSPKCLLWKETHSVNMSQSEGLFKFNLGSGTKISGVTSFMQVFDNNAGALSSLSCDSGSSYTASATDDRLIKIEFNDNNGSGTVALSEQSIKSVPFAMYAEKAGEATRVGGKAISATAPTHGQALIYDNPSGTWVPTTLGGGSGTVTSASVTSANGFGGSVATASTTPAITITTSVTGLLKGDGTGVSAAVAGTDYLSGTVGVANGGTGLTSYTTGDLIYASGAAVLSKLNAGTSGYVLTSNGAGTAPSWQAPSVSGSGTVSSGLANQLAYYQTSTNAVKGLSTVNNGTLVTNNTGAPSMVQLNDGQILIGSTTTGPAPASIAGTANRISVSSGSNSITLSTPQDIHTGASPTFNTVTSNLIGNVTGSASNNVLKVGDAMTGNLIHSTNTGSVYNNTANTFSVTVKAPSSLGSNLNLTLPNSNGTATNVLKTDGGGNLYWDVDATGGTSALSSLTPASATNSINNANFAQAWDWSTLSTQNALSLTANALTTGSILNISSTSASNSSNNGLLFVGNTATSSSGTIVRFQSNSTTAGSGLTIKANGNVGVGTTSPTTDLSVYSASGTGPTLSISTPGISNGQQAMLNFNTNGTKYWQFYANGNTTTNPNDFGLAYFDGGTWYNPLYINSTGMVGVGSVSPTSQLHVYDAAGSYPLKVETNSAISGIQIVRAGGVTGTISMAASNAMTIDSGASNGFIKIASGNVGIGTTSPTTVGSGTPKSLHIHNPISASSTSVHLTNAGTGSLGNDGFSIDSYQAGDAFVWNYENNKIGLGTNNTERMTISADGKVGIGTTTPAANLEVLSATGSPRGIISSQFSTDALGAPFTVRKARGTVAAPAAVLANDTVGGFYSNVFDGSSFLFTGFAGFQAVGAISLNSVPTDYVISTGANTFVERMRIDSNGFIGIGTAPDGVNKLRVYGDVKIGTASLGCLKNGIDSIMAGTCSSDIRYKKDITPLTNISEKLSKIQPAKYKWRTDEFPEKNWSNVEQLGFIAQNVRDAIPELTAEDEDGYLRVNYSGFTMYLVQAINEQKQKLDDHVSICKASESQLASIQSRIDSHDRRIASLENENSNLKSEVSDLKQRLEKLEQLLLAK